MKVVNLSIPDVTWRMARIEAAKRNTSLSAIVRGYLQAMVKGKAPVVFADSPDKDQRERRELVKALKECNLFLGFKPSRGKTYER